MSDLASLMTVSPYAASYLIGDKHATDKRTEQFRQQELAELIRSRTMESQRKQELHPMELEKARLGNQTTQAQLPGVIADSELKGLGAQQKRATIDSDIQEVLGKNEDAGAKRKMESHTRGIQFFTTAGPILSQTPVPLRAGALKGLMEQAGMKADNSQAAQMLQLVQSNPEQFPEMIKKLADKLGELETLQNPAARVSRENNKATNDRTASEGAANRAMHLKIEGMRTERAKELAAMKLKAQTDMQLITAGKMTYEQAAVKWKQKALAETDPEKKAAAEENAVTFEIANHRDAQARKQGEPQMSPEGKWEPTQVEPALGPKKRQQQHSLADVQKMYPGVPADKLKELYKSKFGVDLK